MKIALPYVYSVNHRDLRQGKPLVTQMFDHVEVDIPELQRSDVDVVASWHHRKYSSLSYMEAVAWNGLLFLTVSGEGANPSGEYITLQELAAPAQWGKHYGRMWDIFGGMAEHRREAGFLTTLFCHPDTVKSVVTSGDVVGSSREPRAKMAQECVDGLISVQNKVFRAVPSLFFQMKDLDGNQTADIVAAPTGYGLEKVRLDTWDGAPPWEARRYGLSEHGRMTADFPDIRRPSYLELAISTDYQERFDSDLDLMARTLHYVLRTTGDQVGTMDRSDVTAWMKCRDAWEAHVRVGDDPRSPDVFLALEAVAATPQFEFRGGDADKVGAVIEELVTNHPDQPKALLTP